MRRRTVLGACGAGLVWLGGGCSTSPALVLIGGNQVDPETIDADPVALLPSGIIVLGSLDLVSLFRTPMGNDVAAIVQGLVPLGPESNFSPARDTTRIVGGIYAMQGVDLCAVTQGRFDVAAINRAADARVQVPSGAPIVKTRYGGYDLYTVANIGFVLLTEKTMISGNETGIRRALDRLRFQKLTRVVPSWMIALADTPGASFTVAGDFGAETVLRASADGEPKAEPRPSSSPAQPAIEAASGTLPFLKGLRALRVLGNFQPPGLNFAGALTYATNDEATAGASSIKNLSELGQWMSLLSSIGLGPSIPPARVQTKDNEVGFVQPIDDALARSLLGVMAGFVRRG